MSDTGVVIVIVVVLVLIVAGLVGIEWYLRRVILPRSQRKVEESMTSWPKQDEISPRERGGWDSDEDWDSPHSRF